MFKLVNPVVMPSSTVEITSGVTIDQPTKVLIRCTYQMLIGDTSSNCNWILQAPFYNSAQTEQGEDQRNLELVIEPGDKIYAYNTNTNTGAYVTAIFTGVS